MNTLFSYLYRDSCNYKKFYDVVFSGNLTIDQIEPYFKDGQFFIPSEVGLLDLQPYPFTFNDHIWHEVISLTPTHDLPTINLTGKKITQKFMSAHARDWNEYNIYERKGLV